MLPPDPPTLNPAFPRPSFVFAPLLRCPAAVALAAALALGSATACGTDSADDGADPSEVDDRPRLTPEQLQGALDHVVETVDTVHYQTLDGRPEALVAAIERAQDEIAEPLTEDQLAIVLGRLLASLGDGHSEVDLRPDALAEHRFIELPLVWLAESPVVARATDQLERGDRLTAVGTMNADAIMAALAEHVGHENDHHLRDVAPMRVPRESWLRAMDLVDGDEVEVGIDRGGEALTIRLPLRAGIEPARVPERAFVGYQLEPDDDLGVFYLDDCTYDAQYQATLDEFMQEVADLGLGKIAIDLRNNPGGDATVAFALLAYLGQPYASFAVSVRRSEALLERAPAYDDPAMLGLLEMMGVDTEGPTLDIPGPALQLAITSLLPGGGQVDPSLVFSGEVYVLVSPTTFSSAQLFTALLQDNDLGTVIGEPTGNASDFYGDQLWFDVPDTELRFSLGASWLTRPDPTQPDAAALIPDIAVPTTRQDVLDGRDPQLDAVRSR